MLSRACFVHWIMLIDEIIYDFVRWDQPSTVAGAISPYRLDLPAVPYPSTGSGYLLNQQVDGSAIELILTNTISCLVRALPNADKLVR